MPIFWLFIMVLATAVLGYLAGRMRVMQGAGGDRRKMHSLPSYYDALNYHWDARSLAQHRL